MVVSESYLQSLLAHIISQVGVSPTYVPEQCLGVGPNLNTAPMQGKDMICDIVGEMSLGGNCF